MGGRPIRCCPEVHLQARCGVTYLARHGETASNRMRRYAGRRAEPLTLAGRDQVRELAGDGFDVIFEASGAPPALRQAFELIGDILIGYL